MSIADELNTTKSLLQSAYNKIADKGGTIPSERNMSNLAAAIRSIPGFDPSNPTLQSVKEALDSGVDIPIGLVIPDVYNGQSNPLIVVQKLDSTNNSLYGRANGLILQRQFTSDRGATAWSQNNLTYSTSSVNSVLNGFYLGQCSDELKSLISNITISTQEYSSVSKLSVKWFLPCVEEMYGVPTVTGGPGQGIEGLYFPYWKSQMNVDSPSNAANTGRISYQMETTTARPYWTRTRNSSATTNVFTVSATGAITSSAATATTMSLLPCCFMKRN